MRLLASLAALIFLAKLYDQHVAARDAPPITFRDDLAFLLNPFSAVERKLADEPRPGPARNLAGLALGLAVLAFGLSAYRRVWRADPGRFGFAVDHVLKLVPFYLIVDGGCLLAVSAWRLAGGRGRAVMRAPFLARTPADFWRRYNRVLGQFLWEDVFKPAGGRSSPVRAALLTFAVSAVAHEYAFSVAVGRVLGLQTAFFLLQGAAVALTIGVRPRGWRAWPWTAGTLAFVVASSVLFFASWHEALPFYSRRPPAWLVGP